MTTTTTWLMNSAVLPCGEYGAYTYAPSSWEELGRALREGGVESRIGYAETAAEIERRTGIRPPLNRGLSRLQPGDLAYVVRLRYRVDPARKGQHNPRPEDWEVALLRRVAPYEEGA